MLLLGPPPLRLVLLLPPPPPPAPHGRRHLTTRCMEGYLGHDDEDAMAIQQILEGPRDEKDMDGLLGVRGTMPSSPCPFYCSDANGDNARPRLRTSCIYGSSLAVALHPSAYWQVVYASNQLEGGYCSSTRDDCMAAQTLEDRETEEFLKQIWLGLRTPKEGWRCGRRGHRKRRTHPWKLECSEKLPLASGGRKCTVRKNNDHWTQKEMNSLVNGVAKYGAGKWKEVKQQYFSQSIRTATNIKDKWRNLLKAYVGTTKPNKKWRLDPPLITRIRRLADKYPPRRRSATVAVER
ncbi:hypothetical protein ACP70R_021220 [Stipagrostis hirtigluma subsp. patula]